MKIWLVTLLVVLGISPVWAQQDGQRTFASPEAAAQALVEAVSAQDAKTLVSLIGESAKRVLTSGDTKQDAADRQAFLQACKEKLHLQPLDDSHAMMIVGKENFPFPIPLVKAKSGWYFDGVLGAEEIRARHIGQNELAVIRACEAYVQAQRAYSRLDPEGSGMARYAERFQSSPGKHDGLYWQPAAGEVASPLGPLLAEAGNAATAGAPYHGYRFKILTSQGASAPGGAYSYIINGNMVAGFGLMAYPATYGETGIMTFIMGPAGVIYQQDLKGSTAKVGASMTSFDPTTGWKRL